MAVSAVSSTRAAPVALPRPRTDLETESWRLLREEWRDDSAAQAEYDAWERSRGAVRPAMCGWLDRFLEGEIGLERFRATFDRRTRTDWDAFALKGPAGAGFLNAIAKRGGHPVKLARRLRSVLRVPTDVDGAASQLTDLVATLSSPALELDGTDRMSEAVAAQPTHAVFFASVCWHLHDPDRWPGFHPSSRRALHEEEELFAPTGNPVRDYLLFREAFLSLAAALSMTVWQLEHLCWWRSRKTESDDSGLFSYDDAARRDRPRVKSTFADRPARQVVYADQSVKTARPAVRESTPPYVPFTDRPVLDHTHVQWLLAKVGGHLGCKVWIAANDWRRDWSGERLGSLSVPRLPPLGMSPDSQRVVSLIDVVWLSGTNQVAAAFEVEHTTSVYSGLLRMADLAALSPNLSFPLYIVAPAARLAKVRRELTRPTFRALGLDRRCRFFSSESLLRALPGLVRWATGPDAIEKLAEAASRAD